MLIQANPKVLLVVGQLQTSITDSKFKKSVFLTRGWRKCITFVLELLTFNFQMVIQLSTQSKNVDNYVLWYSQAIFVYLLQSLPTTVSLIFTAKSFKYMLNKVVDRLSPCLTPLLTENQSVIFPFNLTLAIELVYKVVIALYIFPLILYNNSL